MILLLILPFNGLHAAPLAQAGDSAAAESKLSPALQAQMRVSGSGPFDVIVRMETQAIEADPALRRLGSESGTPAARDRLGTTIRSLQAEAKRSQARILAMLTAQRAAGKADAIQSFWIFNGLATSADADTILAMAALPEVASIVLDETLTAPSLSAAADEPVQWNVSMVKVPALWELGYRGQGMVAANLDTGVYLDHPDLADRWRGGANSWFDPYGQHLFPADVAGGSTGHGTSTISIMVGGSTSGSSEGIAPEAQWIAAKIFDDRGQGQLSAIHAAYQWVLDPDGNPVTDDAPDVVNSSWTFLSVGCNLEFELDLEALRAGGVLPVFAAGNLGGRANTSVSPANNPAAFAVGAVDRDLALYAYSSQGPSSCMDAPAYPAIVAPGVDVIAADANGLHHLVSGTSLAAPHVSGLLLLLLQAFPGMSAAQQAEALARYHA